ncbi:MAG: YfhO family protein, partial [Muribaculaceae bacterium]|nr:YfhO family protein [Muribaculaceae bacterium]
SKRTLMYYWCICIFILIVSIVFHYILGMGSIFQSRVITLELSLFVLNLVGLSLWIIYKLRVRTMILFVAVLGCFNMTATLYIYSHKKVTNGIEDVYYIHVFSKKLEGWAPTFEYRTDAYINYWNWSLLKNTPGIFGFHSSANTRLNRMRGFVGQNGLIGHSPAFICYRSRESLGALFSVKTVMDYRKPLESFKSSERPFALYQSGLMLEEKSDTCDIYTNMNYIPIGFTYDNYVTQSDLEEYLEQEAPDDIPVLLLDNIVIQDKDVAELSEYLSNGEIKRCVRLDSLAAERRRFTVTDFIGDTEGFTCRSDFEKPELVFFSVVADPGFTALIDEEEAKIYEVNFGLSAIVVPAGCHEIIFRYFTPGLKTGAIISIVSLVLLMILLWVEFRPIKRCV